LGTALNLLDLRDKKDDVSSTLYALAERAINETPEGEEIDLDAGSMWSVSILSYPEITKKFMFELVDLCNGGRLLNPQKFVPRDWNYFIKIVVPARAGEWYELNRAGNAAKMIGEPRPLDEVWLQQLDSKERAIVKARHRGFDNNHATKVDIEREIMKARGFPYGATFPEYIRFLENNFIEVRILENLTITFQQIKDLFIPSPIKPAEFQRGHTYIVGRSGSGKSELLKKIVEKVGKNCVVIDPHGDLVEDICKLRIYAPVYKIAPHENRFVINPFYIEDKSESNRELVAQEITDLMAELVSDSGLSRLMTTIIFPIVYTLLKLEYADFKMLTDCINPNTGKERLKDLRGLVEPHHTAIWRELEGDTYDSSKQSVFNRLQSLLNYRLVGQTLCGIDDFEKAIEQAESGAILAVSLPIPVIGEAVAVTLGRFFMTRMQIWAKRRQAIPIQDRIPVNLIVDEFHNFLSHATAQTLDQFGRKFRLYMILAHQHIQQITDREIRGSIMANTINKIAGMSNAETKQALVREMHIEPEALDNLRPGHFVARLDTRETFEFYSHFARLDKGRRLEYTGTKNGAEVVDGWEGLDREQNTYSTPETPTRPRERRLPKFDI
jgi:hypothetical protein